MVEGYSNVSNLGVVRRSPPVLTNWLFWMTGPTAPTTWLRPSPPHVPICVCPSGPGVGSGAMVTFLPAPEGKQVFQ